MIGRMKVIATHALVMTPENHDEIVPDQIIEDYKSKLPEINEFFDKHNVKDIEVLIVPNEFTHHWVIHLLVRPDNTGLFIIRMGTGVRMFFSMYKEQYISCRDRIIEELKKSRGEDDDGRNDNRETTGCSARNDPNRQESPDSME